MSATQTSRTDDAAEPLRVRSRRSGRRSRKPAIPAQRRGSSTTPPDAAVKARTRPAARKIAKPRPRPGQVAEGAAGSGTLTATSRNRTPLAETTTSTYVSSRRNRTRDRRAVARRRAQRQFALLALATVLLGLGALAIALRVGSGPDASDTTGTTTPDAVVTDASALPGGDFAALGVLPTGWSSDVSCVTPVSGGCARYSGTVTVRSTGTTATAADQATDALAARARTAGYTVEGSQCLADTSGTGRTCTLTATRRTTADSAGTIQFSALVRADAKVSALLDAGH